MSEMTMQAPAAERQRENGQAKAHGHAPRLDYRRVSPAALRAQAGMELFVRLSGLEESLLHLVKVRASLMNGCAYCVDMHTKDARHDGETEQRLYALPVWRETPFFTPRERAALAWTESVTDVSRTGIPDEAWTAARAEFDEEEMVSLTMAIVTINGWNRLAIAFRNPVGDYVAGSSARFLESLASRG